MPSATAMQASLPDCTMMPWISSSSRARVLTGIIIADVPDGAPPLRQALTLTRNSSDGFSWPLFSTLNSMASVISLLMLAGGAASSAFFW